MCIVANRRPFSRADQIVIAKVIYASYDCKCSCKVAKCNISLCLVILCSLLYLISVQYIMNVVTVLLVYISVSAEVH